MWTQRACNDLGYKLTQAGNPNPNALFTTIPNPDSNSSHYMFLGQPYRVIEDPLSALAPTPSPAHSSSYGVEEPDKSTLAILNLRERNYELKNQVGILQEHISKLEENAKDAELQISTLSLQWKRADKHVQVLEAQTQKAMLRSHTPMQPTLSRYGQATPSRGSSARAQTSPGHIHPAPKTPETPSRQRIQPPSVTATVSRNLQSGTPPVFYSAHASPSAYRLSQCANTLSNTDGLASIPGSCFLTILTSTIWKISQRSSI
ncbi:hypothetical protein B0H34DRAFT_19832 [Crassisporium funariophilum]|nr:hypothetical protein B0H34DRAFT_19832 [Crassisporium funariophilum]